MTDPMKEHDEIDAFMKHRDVYDMTFELAQGDVDLCNNKLLPAMEAILRFRRAATALDRPVDGEREELAKQYERFAEVRESNAAALSRNGWPESAGAADAAKMFRRTAALLRTPPAEPSAANLSQQMFQANLRAAGATGRPGVESALHKLDVQLREIITEAETGSTYGLRQVIISMAKKACAIAKLLEPSA